MFMERAGIRYRLLHRDEEGAWLINYDRPAAPFFVSNAAMEKYQRIIVPNATEQNQRKITPAEEKRLLLIQPLISEEGCMIDRSKRQSLAKQQAQEYNTTFRRVLRLYYRWLASGSVSTSKKQGNNRMTENVKARYDEAIETYYFSSARRSLRDAYDCMLLAHYVDEEGRLVAEHPSWHSFRQYYYRQGYHKGSRKAISRSGLSSYQRNERLHYGSAMTWKDKIGYYQMDATQGDIYLVSRFDPSLVIGRPYIYLAVDTVTELIAGIYIGITAGESAVAACLVNAAADKVAYCARYGIAITPDQWPSRGIAGGIITDKGREFCGNRMDEYCLRYGMERESVPPFRPDCKGLVEKTFDLIQQRYKTLLRGKGVIEPDTMERWSTDYRSQAILSLDEYTRIMIHIILFLNARALKNYPLTPEMMADQVAPTPANLWQWYADMGRSVLLDVDEAELACVALPRDEAKVTQKGVVYRGLTYSTLGFRQLLEQLRGSKVTVAYSPEDISRIYLLLEHNYYSLPLSQASRRYQGLCEEELAAYQAQEQEQIRAMTARETQARVEMLGKVREIIVEKTKERGTAKLSGKIIQDNREQEKGYLT